MEDAVFSRLFARGNVSDKQLIDFYIERRISVAKCLCHFSFVLSPPLLQSPICVQEQRRPDLP